MTSRRSVQIAGISGSISWAAGYVVWAAAYPTPGLFLLIPLCVLCSIAHFCLGTILDYCTETAWGPVHVRPSLPDETPCLLCGRATELTTYRWCLPDRIFVLDDRDFCRPHHPLVAIARVMQS